MMQLVVISIIYFAQLCYGQFQGKGKVRYLKKQPSGVFCRKQAFNFIIKSLQHMCLLVNL